MFRVHVSVCQKWVVLHPRFPHHLKPELPPARNSPLYLWNSPDISFQSPAITFSIGASACWSRKTWRSMVISEPRTSETPKLSRRGQRHVVSSDVFLKRCLNCYRFQYGPSWNWASVGMVFREFWTSGSLQLRPWLGFLFTFGFKNMTKGGNFQHLPAQKVCVASWMTSFPAAPSMQLSCRHYGPLNFIAHPWPILREEDEIQRSSTIGWFGCWLLHPFSHPSEVGVQHDSSPVVIV